jgi:hypothetical protein
MNLFTNFGIRASGSEILLLAPTITFVSKTANSITFTLRNNGPITANIFYQQGVNPPTANFISLNSGQTSSNTTISGLNPSTSYTIFARAQATSAISSSVVSITETTNAATGQQLFTSSGTWVAPAGVTSVSVVCVGGGQAGIQSVQNQFVCFPEGCFNQPFRYMTGGTGGALSWKNNITVVPGQAYTVTVGAAGTSFGLGGVSSFIDTSTIRAGTGSNRLGDGGGNGGVGQASSDFAPGGGGAGGYTGNGQGLIGGSITGPFGGGGGKGGDAGSNYSFGISAGNGGGVGLLGEGANGVGPSGDNSDATAGSNGVGQLYGGGGGSPRNSPISTFFKAGGQGAVRIIWGPGRSFPSTNTGDI